MGAVDVVVCWILALPAVAVFFFVYGVLEDIIKKTWHRKPASHEPTLVNPPHARFQAEPEQVLQVRGYDSSVLFREDTLFRLQELYKQVAQHERNILAILAGIREREGRK